MTRPLILASRDDALRQELAQAIQAISTENITLCPDAETVVDAARQSVAPIIFLDVREDVDHTEAQQLLSDLQQFSNEVVTLIPVCGGSYPLELAALLTLLSTTVLRFPFNPQSVEDKLAFLTARRQPRAGRRIPERRTVDADGVSLTTCTPEIFSMLDQLIRVAAHNVTLLLVGETGSGKTTLAKLIHLLSPRRDKPFHNVACGALPRDLIESELFGHVRGAFTGAERSKVGRFEASGHGTLLLDEIDILGPREQGKLLKVIETGEFELVGSTESRVAHARLVVASNLDLETLTTSGQFRSDLYYRLNVLEFRLPPLRERPLDIVPLAMQFIAECCEQHRVEIRQVSIDFLEALQRYHWPGNLRELKNHMQRAVLLNGEDCLTVNDLSPVVIESQFKTADPEAARPDTEWSLADRVARSERQIVEEALAANGQKRAATAKALGLSRVGLYKKMRKFGMLETKDSSEATR